MSQQADIRHRINEQIRGIREVRLIDAEGKLIGIMPFREALEKATLQGLDLVEMNRNGNPPVCKLLNYGKYKYDLAKSTKEAKKNQHIQDIKEVTVRPATDTHDLATKAKHIKDWLADGDRVRLIVKMKGRERIHPDQGMLVIKEILAEVGPCKSLGQPQLVDGKHIILTLDPA